MADKKPTPRNRLDFVAPGSRRGLVRSVGLLSPAVVEELIDNPNGPEPLTVLRRLPGTRAVIGLEGWPFHFEVRVIEEPGHEPQVVDLRIHSPEGCGEVAITNADLKAIPLARLAAAVGLQTSGTDVFSSMKRWAEPEKHTAAMNAGTPRRGKGRPKKLTDEFLGHVVEYAREAHQAGEPINAYVAASIESEPTRQPRPETVRWWLAQARERGILSPGELSRKRK